MNSIQSRNAALIAIEADEPGAMTELVRGKEEALLKRLKPLVQSQPVTLDMHAVERIDAAGIAALISLYCAASQAGHRFTLVHATSRVEEILQLVGLERIMDSEDANAAALPGCELQLSAA
jgi:anti-anti-sigma factor